MSQGEAGAVIGKTQSHFGKIERGEVRLYLADAVALADAFNTGLESLALGKSHDLTFLRYSHKK
jgi:hypothetical protein